MGCLFSCWPQHTELDTPPAIARTPTVDDLEKERVVKLLMQRFRKRHWQEETR